MKLEPDRLRRGREYQENDQSLEKCPHMDILCSVM